mgnify:CR=1 FL=1
MICDFGGDAPTIADLPRSNQREIADALKFAIDAARDSNHTDSWDHTQAAWTLVPVRSAAWRVLEDAARAYATALQTQMNAPGDTFSPARAIVREFITHLRAALRLVPDDCQDNPHRVTEVLS